MSVNYAAAVKTARMQAVADAIGAGGKLELGTSGMGSVLATITLGATSGTVSGPVLTLSGFPRSDTSADAAGIAASARIRTAADADVITGLTVGVSGSGADVIVDNTNMAVGQTVTINSSTFTHA